MIRARFRFGSVRSAATTLLVAIALHGAPASAIDTGRPGPPPRDPPLDCTNRDNNICIECGQPDGLLACCTSGCDIIIGPQPPPPPPAPSVRPGVIRKGLGSMTYFAR